MAEPPTTATSSPPPPSAVGPPAPALHTPSNVDPRGRRRSRRRPLGCVVAVLAAIVVLAVLGIVAAVLWHSEPEYWQEGQLIRQRSNEELLQIAIALEQRISREISEADNFDPRAAGTALPTEAGPPRSIDLTLEEVNAWLVTRLDMYLAYNNIDVPPQMREFMLTTRGSQMIVAFRYETPEVTQIISGVFRVEPRPDGTAVLRLDGLRGGKLPIPTGFLPRHIDKTADLPQGTRASNWLRQLSRGHVLEPRKLDAVRNYRVLDLQPHGQGVRLTLRTEPRKKGEGVRD